MKNRYFYFLIIFSIFFFPVLTFADGGMMIWPPKVHLDQSAQNAIVAFDGEKEIIILSNDIESDDTATVLRVVPLPSNPASITEGSFDSFEKLTEIINNKLDIVRNEWDALGKGHEAAAPPPGVEVTFHQVIGAHDITTVKVNNTDCFLDWIKDFADTKGLSAKGISSGFKEEINNYLKREIRYFVFDVIDATKEPESIKPLVYQFDSDFLYYPISITGASEIGESRAKIRVFVITKEDIPASSFSILSYLGYPVELTEKELKDVSEEIADLFNSKARVRIFDYYGAFKEIKRDLIVYPSYVWERDLTEGSYGKDVKSLQKVLINEGVWDSEVEATGYFGPITKKALIKLQENYKWQILKPQNIEKGTGNFSLKTKEFFKEVSLPVGKIKKKDLSWERNLSLCAKGDDVKTLQEILIAEGLWDRPDIPATGFFGPITQTAVIKFQKKYALEILTPLGLTDGTGFVGSSTRAYLKKIKWLISE